MAECKVYDYDDDDDDDDDMTGMLGTASRSWSASSGS